MSGQGSSSDSSSGKASRPPDPERVTPTPVAAALTARSTAHPRDPDRAPRSALQPGHDLTLLEGGEAFFAALVHEIEAARREVLVETYLFDFTRSALAVAEALEAAGRRGVRVRVVVDGIGTSAVPAGWQHRWRDAGVQWRVFNPAGGWRMLLPAGWRRLHRKLCVVDERVGFCGGINLIDDRYDPNHGTLERPRFDFSVRIEGPLIADMHDTMTRLWARLQVGRELRRGDLKATLQAAVGAAGAGTDMGQLRPQAKLARPPADERRPPAFAALVLRDNVRFRRSIERHYRRAIGRARREIVIANAYFIPGVRLQRALLKAAARGVRVTLLLQGRYEYFLQYHASRAVYGVLLKAGIRIVEYEASYLHAKVAVIDAEGGAMATVGSSNLDPLSLLLAREANVFVRDDAFAGALHAALMRAIGEGRSVPVDEIARWPVRARGLNWVAWAMVRIALFATGSRY